MQRRVRVSEVEALAPGEHRAELTPFFWQGVAGGFAALLLTGLVFMILSFSQVTQILTAAKEVALFANLGTELSVCEQTESSEWTFNSNGLPAAYMHKSFSYANYEQALNNMYNGPNFNLVQSVDCTGRGTTPATCQRLELMDVWNLLHVVAPELANREWDELCSTGADGSSSDNGLVMNALCEASLIYPPRGVSAGTDNEPTHFWPCFTIRGGGFETGREHCKPSASHGQAARNRKRYCHGPGFQASTPVPIGHVSTKGLAKADLGLKKDVARANWWKREPLAWCSCALFNIAASSSEARLVSRQPESRVIRCSGACASLRLKRSRRTSIARS